MEEKTDKLRSINPCPICGNKSIGVKINIIQMYDNGNDKMEIYAYCRKCNHVGMKGIGRFSDRQDAIDQAYTIWNNTEKIKK